MKIWILNQYGPGDPSPTGRLVKDLEAHWSLRGHEVGVLCGSRSYLKKKGGWRRWLNELWAHAVIMKEGLQRGRPDLVVSFSTPAGLVVTASLMAAWHRARHIHWIMDLYPEVALALGELAEEGLLFHGVRALMCAAYEECDRVIVLDQDMKRYVDRCYGMDSAVIAPWPPFEMINSSPKSGGGSSTGWTWLYSGNLGRAHDWKSLLDVQEELERRNVPATLVFQGGGAGFAEAQNEVRERRLQRVEFRGYVAEEELLGTLASARVRVVSRRPEVTGLLWPSKLAVLLHVQGPLLLVGNFPSQDLGWNAAMGIFPSGEILATADWMQALYTQGETGMATIADEVKALSAKGLERWDAALSQVSK